MVCYSSEGNNWRKKSVLCVIENKGLMDHILPISPCPTVFFINEMSSLINHVRFGTVKAYICGNV